MFVFAVTIIVSLLLKCLKKSESGEAGFNYKFSLKDESKITQELMRLKPD